MATLETTTTYEGKATLRAFYFESAHLYEGPASFIANLLVETDIMLSTVHRIEFETEQEAAWQVKTWARWYNLEN